MPTKSKRAKLSDVCQGKTVWSVMVYQKWDEKTRKVFGVKKIELTPHLLNGKIKKDDQYIFVGTDKGDLYLCMKDGIVNNTTSSVFTKRKAALKFAAKF